MIFINPNDLIKDRMIFIEDNNIIHEDKINDYNEKKKRSIIIYVDPDQGRAYGESKNGQGDWYFKVTSKRILNQCNGDYAYGCARVSILPPAHYITSHGNKTYYLNKDECKELADFFKGYYGMMNWKNLIDTINKHLMDSKFKINTNNGTLYPEIPDYSKLK